MLGPEGPITVDGYSFKIEASEECVRDCTGPCKLRVLEVGLDIKELLEMVTQASDGMIEFAFFRPQARRVFLSGDFNGWQDSFMLRKDDAGWWRCRLHLAPGVYQFRYQADGHWFNDYAAFGLEQGPLGWNSVVKVEKHLIETMKLEAA